MSKNRKASRIPGLWSKQQFFDFLTKYYKWSVRDVLPLLFTQILKIWYFPNCSKEKNISLWNPDPKVQKMARISHFYIWMQSCEFRCKKSPDEVFDTKIGPTTVHQKLFEPNRWKKQLSFRKVNIFLGNVSKSLPPVLENSGQLCFFSDFRNVRNPKNALFWTGPLSGQKRKRQLIINAKG